MHLPVGFDRGCKKPGGGDQERHITWIPFGQYLRYDAKSGAGLARYDSSKISQRVTPSEGDL